MANKKSTLTAWPLVIVVVSVVLVIVATMLIGKPSKEINSFQACKDAGGELLESYPEQCMINGKSFTNEAQLIDSGANVYVGLTEQAALEKAAVENKTARIVERDNESLAVTLDFMPGRLNLSVKDGKVSKVQVEGSEN